MVFARKSDDALASLVKQLDKLLETHKDAKLKAFVNLLGEDREALEAEAKKLAADNEVKQVAIVVPVEFESGPANFGIHPDAETTIMLYSGRNVKFNYALEKGKLEKAAKDKFEDLEKDIAKLIEEK